MKQLFLIIYILIFFILFNSTAFPEEIAEKHFLEGVKYLNDRDFKKAEELFKTVIKSYYGHYPSYFNLAYGYLLNKDYKKSLDVLQEAKTLNPFDMRLDKMLSSAYMALNKYEQAKEHLSSIILKKTDDVSSHKKLGIIYIEENNLKQASSEFALAKNLDPADIETAVLLSLAYTLQEDYSQSLEKLTGLENQLKDDIQKCFYAFVLEKNGMQEKARQIYQEVKVKQENIGHTLLSLLKEKTIEQEIEQIKPIETFPVPEVSQRIAERLKKETPISLTGEKKVKERPLNLKGTLKETSEIYKRTPLSSSPINSFQSTSNLKTEGKTEKNLQFSSEWEWFYNRWDHTVLDYYKVNFIKRDGYEIDIGKFSAKHFPSLVSFPTVIDGIMVWKKLTLPKFEPGKIELSSQGEVPVNLGEIYRKAYNDTRLFKTTEFTLVTGRTLDALNLGARKEKNESTYETSGQFEQWTKSFRVYSAINSFADIGTSYVLTKDRPDSATTADTTNPIKSEAIGIDGNFNLIDNKLDFDWEGAVSNYDEDIRTVAPHKRDFAWLFKTQYKPVNQFNFSYEQKAIRKDFKVEGAYQTEDKISHTINAQYQPSNPQTWDIKALSLKFQPEESNFRGNGPTKKKYRTFQPVISFKLPQDAKLGFDYKYYREYDKCLCSTYRTRTFKTNLDWEIEKLKTTVKPEYTFERKDDRVASPTDEKMKKYSLGIENQSITNLTLKASVEEERKQYVGLTTKAYRKTYYNFETKYALIPYRSDLTFQATRDRKHPSDTNKTESITLSLTWDYTTKNTDDKITLKVERKLNIYEPWSESSAYRQNYAKLQFTHKF